MNVETHSGRWSAARFTQGMYTLGVLLCLVALMGTVSCGGKGDAKGNEGKGKGDWKVAGMKGPDRERFKIPITCERVERQPMESYLLTVGSVVPFREVEIRSEYNGRIYYTRRWKDGDLVDTGTLVAKIDDRSLRLDISEMESQLRVAEDAVHPASAALTQAQKDERYYELMLEKGAVSRSQYEQTVLQRINRENGYEQSLASVETRRSGLEKLQQDLEKIVIKTPFEGILLPLQENVQQQGSQSSDLTLNEGLFVGSGQSICRLADIQQVVVELSVPGKDVEKIRLGQRAVLDIYSKVGREYSGSIYEISSTMDARTRTFTVKVLVDNSLKELRPGMFCKARIVTESHLDSVVISRDLVMLRDGRHVVFVIEEVPDIATAKDADQVDGAIKEMDRDDIDRQAKADVKNSTDTSPAEDSSANASEDIPGATEQDSVDESKDSSDGDDGRAPADGQAMVAKADVDAATEDGLEGDDDPEDEEEELPTKFIARERIVELGLENRDEFEITDGLKEAELLVVIGYETLTDEVDVQPTIRGESPLDEETDEDNEADGKDTDEAEDDAADDATSDEPQQEVAESQEAGQTAKG